MIANPDMDPRTRAAIQNEALLSARSGYADARGNIGRRAANVGNSAGMAAGYSELGRRAAGTYGQITRQNLIDFEKERQRRYETGLSGYQNLYGTEGQYNLGILGLQGMLQRTPRSTTVNTTNRGKTTGTSRNFNFSF
jgi:hypothetical protein